MSELTKREQRVITAFLNCIHRGEYTADYVITLIEDNQRYGWMSEQAKDYFYSQIDPEEPEEPEEDEQEQE